jgi:hypothetical protein
VYADAPQSSSAASFGTLGINFTAVRVSNDAEWSAELAALSCTTQGPSHPRSAEGA